ncbi:MAG TPA: hypothetical protein VMR06_14405 [Dokdonella sp.]|uniref:hypothetical protein n=1 Tax=Dokdonella sp. TaxID=2291710 RepID=UPI002BBF1CC7|nr:hypothetical protein [Dokdonella sp.]HUD43179.1 hypothetical protein [Dokdonella sp.]
MAACRSVPTQAPPPAGEVDAQPIVAASADRYPVSEGATYAQPQPSAENALPVYPADLLAQRLALRIVRVRLIVDAQGRVAEVRALDPDAAGDAFLDAVRAACARWRFSPLTETRAVEERRRLPDGDVEIEYLPRTRALPFHLDYRFAFRQVDGRPIVDAGTAAGADAPAAPVQPADLR